MNDFWARCDKSYRLFSQFCSSEDWHEILSAVAGAVVEHGGGLQRPISILDIGCGTGVTTGTICEHIYSRTGCFPSVSIVEPSKIARNRLESHLLSKGDCGPLSECVERISNLPAGFKTDAILFIHSTYYIEEFESVIQKLVSAHLRKRGAVFALVLPENSPFFLGLPNLPNCSDSVERAFRASRLKASSILLRSRFMLPKGSEFSDRELGRLKAFWMPAIEKVSQFRSKLAEYANEGELDFQDHLVIGQR